MDKPHPPFCSSKTLPSSFQMKRSICMTLACRMMIRMHLMRIATQQNVLWSCMIYHNFRLTLAMNVCTHFDRSSSKMHWCVRRKYFSLKIMYESMDWLAIFVTNWWNMQMIAVYWVGQRDKRCRVERIRECSTTFRRMTRISCFCRWCQWKQYYFSIQI